MKCMNPDCKTASPLYRQNAKGEIGIWACIEHSKPVDPEFKDLVETIAEGVKPDEVRKP